MVMEAYGLQIVAGVPLVIQVVVFIVDVHEGTLRLLIDCVPYSNGICLSSERNLVYVAATRANQVWQFSSRLPKLANLWLVLSFNFLVV